jgi:osmotically-inducible protein OsmY
MTSDMRSQRGDRDFDSQAERDYERRHGRRDLDPADIGRPSEPRSWLARAGDEVAAWFGNPGALGRRQRDKAAGDHSGEGPKNYADADARIVDEVNQKLTQDRDLNATNIKVESAFGAVTLNGSVTTNGERQRAEELATAVAGVSRVQNNLQIV